MPADLDEPRPHMPVAAMNAAPSPIDEPGDDVMSLGRFVKELGDRHSGRGYAARPASVINPAASSFSNRARFPSVQLLFGRRGAK